MGDRNENGVPRTMRIIFGIIMIVIYLTMGVLCLVGFFPFFSGNFEWLRWVAGVILIIYGLYRAYRQFAGIDPDITNHY